MPAARQFGRKTAIAAAGALLLALPGCAANDPEPGAATLPEPATQHCVLLAVDTPKSAKEPLAVQVRAELNELLPTREAALAEVFAESDGTMPDVPAELERTACTATVLVGAGLRAAAESLAATQPQGGVLHIDQQAAPDDTLGQADRLRFDYADAAKLAGFIAAGTTVSGTVASIQLDAGVQSETQQVAFAAGVAAYNATLPIATPPIGAPPIAASPTESTPDGTPAEQRSPAQVLHRQVLLPAVPPAGEAGQPGGESGGVSGGESGKTAGESGEAGESAGEPTDPSGESSGTAQPGSTSPGTTPPGTTSPGTASPGSTPPGAAPSQTEPIDPEQITQAVRATTREVVAAGADVVFVLPGDATTASNRMDAVAPVDRKPPVNTLLETIADEENVLIVWSGSDGALTLPSAYRSLVLTSVTQHTQSLLTRWVDANAAQPATHTTPGERLLADLENGGVLLAPYYDHGVLVDETLSEQLQRYRTQLTQAES